MPSTRPHGRGWDRIGRLVANAARRLRIAVDWPTRHPWRPINRRGRVLNPILVGNDIWLGPDWLVVVVGRQTVVRRRVIVHIEFHGVGIPCRS